MPSIVRFKIIQGTFARWEELMGKAAVFATAIGRERLITIAHSEDRNDGVIAVWYWDDEPPAV
jgi:hypothetical protein